MIERYIWWDRIQNRLDSCRKMSEASETNEAKKMLKTFAEDLLKELEKL